MSWLKILILSFSIPGQNDSIAKKYYKGFIRELKKNSFNYLDAYPICNQLKLGQQVVSGMDAHLSVKLQRLVADSIYNRLVQAHWFDDDKL